MSLLLFYTRSTFTRSLEHKHNFFYTHNIYFPTAYTLHIFSNSLCSLFRFLFLFIFVLYLFVSENLLAFDQFQYDLHSKQCAYCFSVKLMSEAIKYLLFPVQLYSLLFLFSHFFFACTQKKYKVIIILYVNDEN